VSRILRASTIALTVVVASCTGAAPGTQPSVAPTRTPSAPSVAPPSGTSSPTVRATPPPPDFVPPTVATFPPAGDAGQAWDLVALGDSNVSGWGVRDDQPFSPQAAFPGVYAGLLAEEQGVTVTLHSYYPDQLGNEVRTVSEWADVVRADPSMRSDLASAEVVILLIGYHDLLPVVLFGSCPMSWPEMRDCARKLTDPMPAAFADLYAEVAELVPDAAPVLVNDYGIPWPMYDRWSADPAWDEIRGAVYEGWRAELEAAAVAAGFRIVHTYAALNEPDGRPRWPADDLTSDGWHFNAEGHAIIADIVLAEDGLDAP
jgi:lysophospholipase L1-like esterase